MHMNERKREWPGEIEGLSFILPADKTTEYLHYAVVENKL